MAQPGLLLDNRYRLDDRIAAGGMGEVWRGSDLLLHRQVAVKVIQPGYAQDAEGLARFRAEARYAGSLAHRNIAMVYDYWEGDPPGQPYLVMELVEGPSLAGILERGAIGVPVTLDVVAQAAAGLQAAHAAGVVHRDIKPANLLVNRDGLIKISDFGIARAGTSAALTSTGQVIGTVAYMAPERVTGQPATPATDLYALGVVAYECLTGKRPFEGEPLAVALAHQEQGLPPLPPAVPAEVARLVAELTAKNPRARPASAGEVAGRAQRLRAALAGQAGGLLAAAAAGPAGDRSLPSPAGLAGEPYPPAQPASGSAAYAGTEAYSAGRTRPDDVAFPGGASRPDGTTPPGDRTARFPGSEVAAGGGPLPGGGGNQPKRRRKLLITGAAAAGALVLAAVAWLAFAPGGNHTQPPHPQAARRSTRPAGPGTPPSQGGAETAPQHPATSAPASTPVPAPSTPPASVTPSPTVSSSSTALPTSSPTPTSTATPSTPASTRGSSS